MLPATGLDNVNTVLQLLRCPSWNEELGLVNSLLVVQQFRQNPSYVREEVNVTERCAVRVEALSEKVFAQKH